jgi:hypothetical protein
MAIRINVTANVSNIQEIRKKIEGQLKNLQLSIGNSIGGKGGLIPKDDLNRLQATVGSVTQMINKLRAGDLSKGKFLELANREIAALKKQPELLKDRARLTEYVGRIQSKVDKETAQASKNNAALIEKELRLKSQIVEINRQAAIKGNIKSKVAEYRQESDALRQLVKDSQRGKLSTEEMAKAGNELVASMKRQEKEVEQLGGKTKTMVLSRKEQEAQLKELIN